jgi:hypothetical protein
MTKKRKLVLLEKKQNRKFTLYIDFPLKSLRNIPETPTINLETSIVGIGKES